jgi:DNA-binding NarL/FixJ family response regulator
VAAERRSDLYALLLVAPGPLCESLRALLSAAARTQRVLPVSGYDEALEALSAHRPQLVVIAMAALEGEAQRLLEHLASEWPTLPCLVLAESIEQQEWARRLHAGDVLLQGIPAARLTQAFERLAHAAEEVNGSGSIGP